MNSSAKRDNTTPSCTVCHRRKVKCDRVYPCAACKRSGLECIYSAPSRKRKHKDGELASSTSDPSQPPTNNQIPANIDESRIDERTPQTSNGALSANASPQAARLLSEGPGYRYVNNYIWNALPKALATSDASSRTLSIAGTTLRSPGSGLENGRRNSPEEANGADHGRSFLFSSSLQPAASLPLPPNYIVTLWQKFLDNVDPVMKIFHVPTVQQLVLGQIGKQSLAIRDQCLAASIYFISVVSLNDQECRDLLQIGRERLLSEFRQTTERALSAANFVTTTDIVILQALVLYLAALKSLGETQTVWPMSGLAARIAGSIGLARDGSVLDLPPFDCEMRRRLWWALVYIDARTAEYVGQDSDLLVQPFDVRLPSNLGDSELFPSMKKAPESRKGPTEAIYIVQRAFLGSYVRSNEKLAGLTRAWTTNRESNLHSRENFEAVRSLERQVNENFVEYCDPTVPIQLLTIITAKTMVTKLLLTSMPASSATESYSHEVFSLSLEIIEGQLSIWTDPTLKQWQWYWTGLFQWYALLSLIRQTRLCTTESLAKKAWTAIWKALDIIIPTVDVGPEKIFLLDGIKSLLNAAASTQNVKEAPASEDTEADEDPPPKRHTNPAVPSFAIPGHGSRPHSALLPGMTTNPAPDIGDPVTDGSDCFVDFDVDAIDWTEFDRLASELFDQQNPSEITSAPNFWT